MPGRVVRNIGDALQLWNTRTDLTPGRFGVFAVLDSSTYREDLDVVVPPGDRLLLVATALPQGGALPTNGVQRPTTRRRAPDRPGVTPPPGRRGPGGRFGRQRDVPAGRAVGRRRRHPRAGGPGGLGTLVVSDATLLYAGGQPTTSEPTTATVDAGGADVRIATSTVLGPTVARVLTAGNAILDGLVRVGDPHQGCIRFSYLPLDSTAPGGTAASPGTSPRPPRSSRGSPRCDPATPGSGSCPATAPSRSLGAPTTKVGWAPTTFLQQSRRTANLVSQLEHYLRFGLEAGIFFAT